jgi:enoyl-CoA hydratase/carnithine racemase
MSGKVRFELDGEVGIITLADPPLNLFSLELIDGLDAAQREAEAASVRALLFRADGENFTAGAKVDDVFQGLSALEGEERVSRFRGNVRRAESAPFPSVAAVRGLCLAAGLEAVLAMDLIWASETAMFAFAEPTIGLVPPAGGLPRFAARAGVGRAAEAVLTGRPYSAQRLEEWGVVNRVLPDDELDEKSLAFAHKLAAGPTRAYVAAKEMLLAYRDHAGAAADAAAPKICAPLFETDDLANGIESLLADGPGQAKFAGR